MTLPLRLPSKGGGTSERWLRPSFGSRRLDRDALSQGRHGELKMSSMSEMNPVIPIRHKQRQALKQFSQEPTLQFFRSLN